MEHQELLPPNSYVLRILIYSYICLEETPPCLTQFLVEVFILYSLPCGDNGAIFLFIYICVKSL